MIKPVGGSGGYGIVVGPQASRAELAAARARIEAEPANFISQQMIRLSVCPTLTEAGIEPRHVDLRPFAVTGAAEGLTGAGATHAWVQVYLPGAGWVEYDPTNGLVGGTNLIRSRSRAIPSRRSRSRAASTATPRTSSAWKS